MVDQTNFKFDHTFLNWKEAAMQLLHVDKSGKAQNSHAKRSNWVISNSDETPIGKVVRFQLNVALSFIPLPITLADLRQCLT